MTDDLFDEGNIIKMPEPQRDLQTELDIATQRCDHLERKLAEKEYELDLTGAMARLNVAGQVLGGIYAGHYAQPESVLIDVESCCIEAMEVADTLVSAYEQKMEERAASFMATRALGPNDPLANPTTEN